MSPKNHYINAKQEFEDHVGNKGLYCAYVEIDDTDDLALRPYKITANLRVGYTAEDYQKFLALIDHTYNNSYGKLRLFGKIWHTPDTLWSTRRRGLEAVRYWVTYKSPTIPECLK